MDRVNSAANLGALLRDIVGDAHVRDDEPAKDLFGADIYARGARPAFVVAPGGADEAAQVIAAATSAGAPVLPRGAGMSYTGGYVGAAEGAVLLDLRRLNRIIAIDAENMVVHVEAGATWADLHAALAPKGLRTPFWGPLSGLTSTIGGGLSQNNALLGGTLYGPSTESAVALKVALADGRVIRTGGGDPAFFRHFGPDLTGLFLGDCGAFGVKLEATLRLIRAPAHEGWSSFAFADRASCAAALSEISRASLASEAFAFDPRLARVRMKRASLMADAASLAKVVGAQKSLVAGLKEGARVVLAGRSFIADDAHSAHFVAEGRSRAAVEADLAEIAQIAKAFGGAEIENTIPKVIRAQPFTPLNNILGPTGERWVPVHGIVPHSAASQVWNAIEALFETMSGPFADHGIETGYLTTTLSTNGFLIEPVFYWPDERFAVHDATVDPAMLSRMTTRAANPAARAVVADARARVIDIFTKAGACHFQVGRAYPYTATRTPDTYSMLVALKAALDPQNLMNPGVLGLNA
ncbi:MAG: FAD-binding oxidoreductase [Caulobacterales bacterium]